MTKNWTWAQTGATLCGLAVVTGAFGAHGLEEHFQAQPRHGEIYQTAVLYQMFHGLALLSSSCLGQTVGMKQRCAWAFFIGILLFCGSLYGIVATGVNALGAVTPLGGTAFLVGWFLMALDLSGKNQQPHETKIR